MNRLKQLCNLGQSLWYDNIERGLLVSGRLQQMIDEDCITGVTSNPSIFEKAINGSRNYDADVQALGKSGLDGPRIYDELTSWDIERAAGILFAVYQASGCADGFVSVEVSPRLAHDTEATVAEAKRIHAKINRPNVMIKVPATGEGVEAVRRLTAEGISVNATLIFSLHHYNEISRAYLRGLEERIEKGSPVANIHSVASFFVSRIDTYVDRLINDLMLKEADQAKLKDLQGLVGKAAVAQAKIINDSYRRTFYGPQFSSIKAKGGSIQRLLFGSTSTKNPSYRDVKYVEELIGEGTINTLPHATLDAFRDHGVAKPALSGKLPEARAVMAKLRANGIVVEDLCQTIQDDGVQAFVDSYDKLISSLEEKKRRFVP